MLPGECHEETAERINPYQAGTSQRSYEIKSLFLPSTFVSYLRDPSSLPSRRFPLVASRCPPASRRQLPLVSSPPQSQPSIAPTLHVLCDKAIREGAISPATHKVSTLLHSKFGAGRPAVAFCWRCKNISLPSTRITEHSFFKQRQAKRPSSKLTRRRSSKHQEPTCDKATPSFPLLERDTPPGLR